MFISFGDFFQGLFGQISKPTAEYNKDVYSKPEVNYGKNEKTGENLPCGTELHTCVPTSECNEQNYSGARICTRRFKKIGGACYYFFNKNLNKVRSRPEARKFCEALGGSLVFIESKEEFNELSTRIPSGTPHWTEGFYNPGKSAWVWETNKEEINFKFVHPESGQLEDVKEPGKDSRCLSFNGTGLYPSSCFTNIPFVCKEGYYDNICERYGNNKCCFIPSYEYFFKSSHGVNSQSVRSTSPCFVTFNSQIITCSDAFRALQAIPAIYFRLESSIYYVMPADEGCGKNTEVVISSKNLHLRIVRFLSLFEKHNIKVRIGLHATETPTKIEFKWANGKSVHFYGDKYWAVGHPQLKSKAECVMYELTEEYGGYFWHTQDDETVCYDPNNFVMCQLPMRNHNYSPNLKKVEGCGERKSHGVLGRSYPLTSADPTQFGELPWQAAISVSGSFSGNLGIEFACSGVLISYDSIITSAHCAINAGESMVISLGDYDLLGANRRKLLYPEYRTVEESIIHPGYRPGKNDIAILRLSEAVNYNAFPHIGIGCLPTHSLVYGSGDWECYVTGWPKVDSYGNSQVLSRIEVEFTSRQKCVTATNQFSTGYNYGYSGQRNNGRTSRSNLLCVEMWEPGSCIEDNTAMLICKKSQEYLDDPFSSGFGFYDDNTVSNGGLYDSSSLTLLQQWEYAATKILNSYIQDRSDNDRWYLLGIGHESNSCDGYSNTMLFEPVHEHMAFIHANVDLKDE
ncbi:unnamed protein product [Meganyctiphanes norvegica]|uniref:C-type lectin domain-containing protein n=1 Tax=Meganyctiphanes norvegica TaxID=48144 RepID=A0AAV2R3X5_MEGNR